MIDRDSIEELISQLDIVDVISSEVTLEKRGSTFVGCCPFHNEKSGSFTVSKAKQIFKCFGCGEGGDAIAFVMKKEKVDFLDAVRSLASRFNFTLKEVEISQEEKEKAEKKVSYSNVNAAAAVKFREALMDLQSSGHWVTDELRKHRRFSAESISDFEIGYAPDQARFLCEFMIQNNSFYQAEELGLVKTGGEGNTFDVFRDRIIFPIHNDRGQIVGFGGRKDPANEEKAKPKYVNSKDSFLYSKEKVLYGLHLAKKHIRELGYAIIVEGYTDVISMHQAGICNTVAACGTALTPAHAKLLFRFTKHVILMSDGDDAGQKANFRSTDILLSAGFGVEICPLPKKEDPDTYARKHFEITEVI